MSRSWPAADVWFSLVKDRPFCRRNSRCFTWHIYNVIIQKLQEARCVCLPDVNTKSSVILKGCYNTAKAHMSWQRFPSTLHRCSCSKRYGNIHWHGLPIFWQISYMLVEISIHATIPLKHRSVYSLLNKCFERSVKDAIQILRETNACLAVATNTILQLHA